MTITRIWRSLLRTNTVDLPGAQRRRNSATFHRFEETSPRTSTNTKKYRNQPQVLLLCRKSLLATPNEIKLQNRPPLPANPRRSSSPTEMNKKESPSGISSPRVLEKKRTRARVVKCVKAHKYVYIYLFIYLVGVSRDASSRFSLTSSILCQCKKSAAKYKTRPDSVECVRSKPPQLGENTHAQKRKSGEKKHKNICQPHFFLRHIDNSDRANPRNYN